jgi:hypothetical protein
MAFKIINSLPIPLVPQLINCAGLYLKSTQVAQVGQAVVSVRLDPLTITVRLFDFINWINSN